MAFARGAEERGGALGPRRHELAAAVHGVSAGPGGVVALALHVPHHRLAVLILTRRLAVGVRLRPVLLGPHGCEESGAFAGVAPSVLGAEKKKRKVSKERQAKMGKALLSRLGWMDGGLLI